MSSDSQVTGATQAPQQWQRVFPMSKKPPWYKPSTDLNLSLVGRQVLEEYSHIPPAEIESHICHVVSGFSRPSQPLISFSSLPLPSSIIEDFHSWLMPVLSVIWRGKSFHGPVLADSRSSHLSCLATHSILRSFPISAVP